MEKDACVEPKNGDAAVDQPKPAATAPYRYTKEELLEIKALPISNEGLNVSLRNMTVMVSGTLRNGMPHYIPLQSEAHLWKVLRRTTWMTEFH